jgi:transcriptional regulator with XRE-family HTH domain
MQAAGVYIRILRKQRQLSQSRLAEIVGVTGNTIWRIEAGKQEPGAGVLGELLTTLEGRIEDVQELLSNPAATVSDGERRDEYPRRGRARRRAGAEELHRAPGI